MSDTPKDQQLDEAYRRASAADAGRPDAATRAAILAEAAAAARKRTPAANDSRYWLRAVAGVAVIGVAILIWRQTDAPMPGELALEAPASATQRADADAGAEPQAALDLDPLPSVLLETSPPPPSSEAPESARERREQNPVGGARDAPAGERTSARLAEAPAPPPSAVAQLALPPLAEAAADSQAKVAGAGAPQPVTTVESEELAEIRVTGSRVERSRAVGPRSGVAGSRAAPARQIAAYNARALLQSHFPAQYQSNQPHRLWAVLDSDAEVVESGEIAADQDRDEMLSAVQDRLGLADSEEWRVHEIINARGQRLEIAVARAL